MVRYYLSFRSVLMLIFGVKIQIFVFVGKLNYETFWVVFKHSVSDQSEIFHSRVIFWMNQIIATLLVFEECILVRFHFNFISSPFLLIGVDVYYAKLVCQNGQKERDILSHGFWLFSLVSAKFENSINLCVQ